MPFLFALAIAAFSLGARPSALSSTLAPDAFEGAPAFARTAEHGRALPAAARQVAVAIEELAEYVARALEGLGGTAGGGFSVHRFSFNAQTIDGERSLTNVVAQRAGSTSEAPIVILAHRDAAARGSRAELSGTAALLELARVFAARETKRPIVLVSTSGGSGGDAGAAALTSEMHGPFDAAIVLGDVASTRVSRPFVVPFSDGLGSAPLQLQRTVADAIAQQLGANPGSPSALGQLAHLTFPLSVGEQAVLDAGGLPAVLIQASGERGTRASRRPSAWNAWKASAAGR